MTRTMQTHRRSTGPDVIASREADHGDGVQAQQEKGDRPYAYYHAHPNLQSWNPPSAAPPQRPPELVHMRLQSKYMREANEISREHNILLREQNDILRKKNDIMLELNRSLQHGVQRMLQRVTTKGGMDVETSGSQGRKRPPPERTDRTDQVSHTWHTRLTECILLQQF